jgi:DNA-binding MarR family transcriptional regulator
MTATRARGPSSSASVDLDRSYFLRARPVGLLLANLAAIYEGAFIKGLKADASFSSITPADHAVLRCVAHQSATSAEIARTLGLSKQAIGKTVSSLERRGFVARSSNDADLRAQIVSMTDNKGRRLIERSIRVAKELDSLTEETLGAKNLSLLKDLLVRIKEAEDRLARA